MTVCVQCVDLSEEEVSSRAPEDYDRGGPLFVSFCDVHERINLSF